MIDFGVALKARMRPQKDRSSNVTWKALVGKKNGGKAGIRIFSNGG